MQKLRNHRNQEMEDILEKGSAYLHGNSPFSSSGDSEESEGMGYYDENGSTGRELQETVFDDGYFLDGKTNDQVHNMSSSGSESDGEKNKSKHLEEGGKPSSVSDSSSQNAKETADSEDETATDKKRIFPATLEGVAKSNHLATTYFPRFFPAILEGVAKANLLAIEKDVRNSPSLEENIMNWVQETGSIDGNSDSSKAGLSERDGNDVFEE